jgi:hypothetical protein
LFTPAAEPRLEGLPDRSIRLPTLLLLLLSPAVALAAPPASSSAAPGAAHEFNIVPIAGGDSDVGLGIGQVSDVASLRPGPQVYHWKLESGAFITFKKRSGEDLIIPYQDYYLVLTVPNLTKSERLRFDVRPAFTNESTLKYYGIGNASPLPPAGLRIEDSEYERMHPTLSIEARFRVYENFFLMAGSIYTYNHLVVGPTTVLARQQTAGPPEVRAMLGSFADHGVELLEIEAQLDTRDNETVTQHGQFHTALLRVSPRLGNSMPYSYQRLTLTARFYGQPIERWLSLSVRAVGDTLFGTPPFYELARFDETPAIGGGKALRGVPAQRYYGKVKLFGNFEARSNLWPFTVRGKPMVLGVAAFFDAGRSWTELGHSHPELDGTGIGLKYGIGGGLRLQQGQTFIVRADIAWSPDAQPVGAYFAAGQIF